MTPTARLHAFNVGWGLKRICDLLSEEGTQNAKGEWKVIMFQEPLGAKVEKPRR